MPTLNTHYKERQPQETINNITSFFNTHGFTIKMPLVQETEAKTWFCGIELYQNDICLGHVNGKGMTKDYCIASGLGELYERFCNQVFFLPNINWARKYIETNKQVNGYALSPEEKLMTYEEGINACHRVKDYLTTISGNNTILQNNFLNFVTDRQYIGVPMTSLLDKENKIYVDPRVLKRVTYVTGMSAGNT